MRVSHNAMPDQNHVVTRMAPVKGQFGPVRHAFGDLAVGYCLGTPEALKRETAAPTPPPNSPPPPSKKKQKNEA